MKAILLISLGLIGLSGRVFPQCAAGGLKIQSAACEDPKSLMVSAVSCSSLTVTWQGNKTQNYIVNATFTDPATSNVIEEKGTSVAFDDNGNCTASIPAKERTVIKWNVQAVCLIDSAIIYSAEIPGPEAYMPFCKKVIEAGKANILHVYPNPATNYLNVEFDGKTIDAMDFRIFDVAGKQVYNKPGNITTAKINNHYKLDLRSLPAGTYLLEVHNGKEVNQVKFVMLHKD